MSDYMADWPFEGTHTPGEEVNVAKPWSREKHWPQKATV